MFTEIVHIDTNDFLQDFFGTDMQHYERVILEDIAYAFQLAQQGNKAAQQSIQLLKHMTCGQAYSGITNQEALQMVNELDMPEEWKRQARDSVSYPVKEGHV